LSQLYQISESCGNTDRRADVVFVHGLGGDAFATWRKGEDDHNYWPNWIGQEFDNVGIWSLGYAASPTRWERVKGVFSKKKHDYGHAMPLPDRARQVLDLLVKRGLGKRPILFICHSLGGLLVKQILRISNDAIDEPLERSIFENTRAVLFIATPHSGAELATLIKRLTILLPTVAVDDLEAHGTHLRDLYEWYRGHAAVGIQTRTYYEMRLFKGILIVDPTSAHPGLGTRPVPLDEDHISITKLSDRNAQVYLAATDLLRNHVLNSSHVGSFDKDIEVLKKQSRITLEDLSGMSSLRVGDSVIKINRLCAQELRLQVEEKSLVVTGEPGAGKSGALYELGTNILQEKRDIVFLAVDRIDAENETQLKQRLGIQHDLEEVLQNWTGDQPAFLVIDALDAARSDRTAQLLSNLLTRINRTKGRWRVLASIRKFDLRHNRELRNLFFGRPPSDVYMDPELKSVCHVQIPVFSEEELSEIGAMSDELEAFFLAADDRLKQLLRVPFNLRLMGELLGDGVSVAELTPIRSQLELLDRYWEERVVRPNDGKRDAREEVLRRAASQMVENRILRVSRSQVVTLETSRVLDQILSEHVLIEWQPSVTSRPDDSNLTFAHHMLFDYAVERLLLRNGMNLKDKLATDPELVLVIRPSLDMHFQYLWSLDNTRSLFWVEVLQVMENDHIPEIGKLIGPVIAANSCTSLSDFQLILQTINDPLHKTSAEAVLRHVIGGLLAMAEEGKANRITGQTAGPWTSLVEQLSQRITGNIAYIVRTLLTQVCERSMSFTIEQLEKAGVAARNLLEFAWSQNPRDEWLIKHSISCVYKTYISNPEASGNLLRLALHKDNLTKYGYQEVPWLVYEAANIFTHDPAFYQDLCIAAFCHTESSEQITSLGGSILSLNSNRRQDYSLGLYQIGEDFGSFIECAPLEALETLISIIENYVLTEHTWDTQTDYEKTFQINGMKAVIRSDLSYIWDTGQYIADNEPIFKMMNSFQVYYSELGMDPNQTKMRQELLNVLIRRNRMAAMWRRLLICGTAAPAILGMEIRSLCWTVEILQEDSTSEIAGDFLRAMYSYLSLEEREKVESTILSISSTLGDDFKQGELIRDRLLGCLPNQYIRTSEVRQRISELAESDGAVKNEPPIRININDLSDFSERSKMDIKNVDDIEIRGIQELKQPVEIFVSKHQESGPSIEALKDVLPALRELWDALMVASESKEKDYAMGTLIEGCAYGAKCNDITCNEDPGAFLLFILSQGSQHPEPRSSPEYDARFEKNLGWSKSDGRIYAARGLVEFARHPSGTTPELLGILEKLITDHAPSVRYQVVKRLLNLYPTANDFMWRLINLVVAKETNQKVIQLLVDSVLNQLANNYPNDIINIVVQICDQAPIGAPVRTSCFKIFRKLYLLQAHEDAREVLQDIITNPLLHFTECRNLVKGLREVLKIDKVDYSNTDHKSVRTRSWALLLQIMQETREKWLTVEKQSLDQGGWTEKLQDQAKNLSEIVLSGSMEVYFATGAHLNKQTFEGSVSIPINPESQNMFLTEAGAVLEILADFSFPRASYYLLRTLEHLVPADSVKVFLLIGQTINSGKKSGLQYENMAADLVVKLVERYLAEYRMIFQDNYDCRRTLMELLDVFVQVGWPEAHRLTYRISDIFR